MLELNTLLFNASSLPETTDKNKDSLVTESVPCFKTTEKEDEHAVDPNSFLFLMAQVLDASPEKSSLGLNLNAEIQGNPEAESNETLSLFNEKKDSNPKPIEFSENHGAMLWINSESYGPSQLLSESVEIKAEQSIDDFFEVDAIRPPLAFNEEDSPLTKPVEKNLTQEAKKIEVATSTNPVLKTIRLDKATQAEVETELSKTALEKMNQSNKGEQEAVASFQHPPKAVVENKNPSNVLNPLSLETKQLSQSESKPLDKESFFLESDYQSFANQLTFSEDKNKALSQDKSQTELKQSFAYAKDIESLSFSKASQELSGSNEEQTLSLKREALVSNVLGAETQSKNDVKTLELAQPLVSPNVFSNPIKSDSVVTKIQEGPLNLNNPEWSSELSERLVWLGEQGSQNTTIKIHPEDLGPLEISVKVLDDVASVSIASHSSQVRDMLDQALPKLREMMVESGLNLSEVLIESEGKSKQFSQQRNHSEQELATFENDKLATPTKTKVSKGLVDYFA